MSLQVWLPLCGDLRNQGLSAQTSTITTTPTWATVGKIGGKSLYTKTRQTTMYFPNLVGISTYSVAYWLYIPTATAPTAWSDMFGIAFNCAGTTMWERDERRAATTTGRHNYHLAKSTSEGSNTNSYYATREDDSANDNWVHYVLTKDDSSAKLYADGKSVVTVPATNFESTKRTMTGNVYLGDNGCEAYLNDFRIYDHCLSPMEVKELSKGLVLHYPLNRGGWGQENLLLNTNTPATWSQGVNSSNYAVHDCFKTQSPVPSLFSVDELITISFDWSTTATGGNFHVECGAVTPWVWGTVISSKGTRNSASNYIDINASNQSGHVEITFKITSSQTGAADTLQWLRIRHDGADTANKTFTISNAKLERGSIATPWCPNSSDALAVTMTLNGTTEYDCSGFCNNGTRVGTFEWMSDTPKYNVSTNFDGSGVRIHSAALPTETQTISVWAKTTKNKSTAQCILGDSASGICMFIYGGGLITYFRGSAGGTGSRVTFGNEYKENDWNHFVVVKTGDMTRDAYCNGVKLATTANNYYTHAEGFWVGARNANNQLPFYGQISDIRAYVTALSASDVKSLYQNSAYIDSSGNVYGAVHEEG